MGRNISNPDKSRGKHPSMRFMSNVETFPTGDLPSFRESLYFLVIDFQVKHEQRSGDGVLEHFFKLIVHVSSNSYHCDFCLDLRVGLRPSNNGL